MSLEPKDARTMHRTAKSIKLTVEGPPMFNMTTAMKTHTEDV